MDADLRHFRPVLRQIAEGALRRQKQHRTVAQQVILDDRALQSLVAGILRVTHRAVDPRVPVLRSLHHLLLHPIRIGQHQPLHLLLFAPLHAWRVLSRLRNEVLHVARLKETPPADISLQQSGADVDSEVAVLGPHQLLLDGGDGIRDDGKRMENIDEEELQDLVVLLQGITGRSSHNAVVHEPLGQKRSMNEFVSDSAGAANDDESVWIRSVQDGWKVNSAAPLAIRDDGVGVVHIDYSLLSLDTTTLRLCRDVWEGNRYVLKDNAPIQH